MTNPRPFAFLHSTHEVRFAPGALADVGPIAEAAGARRAAVVADSFFDGSEPAARLAETLARATGRPPVFHFVPPKEPDTTAVEDCRAALAPAEPELVVALGGGSAMDTAKVARMLLANPGPADAIAGIGTRMRPHPSLFVCLPTTAGTGSEVSESAVIAKAGDDYKLIYRAPEMSARVALLDPELAVSAPPAATANAGYDAVTHAVEAYVSRMASPMTDALALSAMALLAAWLPVAYREPADIAARGACLIAACQAGIAFNSANLGLAHAVSGALGALFHVAHGLANALALPAVVAFNEPALGDKGRRIAAIFGGDRPAEGLARLREPLGLDRGLDEFVATEAERAALAAAAMRSGQVRMNPRPAGLEDMHAIIEAMRAPLAGRTPLVPAP